MLITFVSCQKEDLKSVQEQEVTTKPLFKKRTVSLTEIPKIKQKVIEKLNPEVFNRTEGSNTNEAIFNADNIVEIADTLNNVNYSFQFRFPDTSISTFYNLVVGETPNGDVLTPFVMKYKCDDAYLDQYIANGLDFQYFVGTMSIHKYTDFFALGEFDRTETQCPPEFNDVGDPISCSQDPVDGGNESCCSDGYNGPGDGNTGGGGNGTVICTNQVYVTGCGGDSTNVLHPIGECWNPNQTSVVRHNVWVCDGEAVLGPNNTDTGRTVNDNCPGCGSPTGGVGTNPVSLADMQDYLKDNLDLSYNGLNFIGNQSNLTSVSSVNSLYYFLKAHLSPVTNEPIELAEVYAEEIIEVGGNGNLVKASPYVKYPEGSNYETLYPKLTTLLKNDLPKISNNDKVINKIHEITDAPKETIKEALKWGKGPTIQIQQLGGEGETEKLGSYRGHLSDEFLNILFLDIDLVNDYETSEVNEISDALAFLIAVTILHEYNHLGDVVFGGSFWSQLYDDDPFNTENEAGLIFEVDMFGQAVWRSNAGLILAETGGF